VRHIAPIVQLIGIPAAHHIGDIAVVKLPPEPKVILADPPSRYNDQSSRYSYPALPVDHCPEQSRLPVRRQLLALSTFLLQPAK
jgi:hypothetical protein